MPKSTHPANELTGFYISHILIQRVKVNLSCAERIVAPLFKKSSRWTSLCKADCHYFSNSSVSKVEKLSVYKIRMITYIDINFCHHYLPEILIVKVWQRVFGIFTLDPCSFKNRLSIPTIISLAKKKAMHNFTWFVVIGTYKNKTFIWPTYQLETLF